MRNVEQLEKFVGILHDNLSLTTEKMKPFESLSHFGIPSALEVNLQELVLKHPTFSTSQQKEADIQSCLGGTTVWCLLEPPVYNLRRKMPGLILSGCHWRNGKFNSACCGVQRGKSENLGNRRCHAHTMNSVLEVVGGFYQKSLPNDEEDCLPISALTEN